jgi:uncharacterized OB-fold protein
LLYTYTVNHHQWYPGIDVPYILGIVQLDEQEDVRLTTAIVGCEPDTLTIGMSLRVTFRQLEDVWLPFFEPDG